MRRILIATTNQAKFAEYGLLLRAFRLKPVSLREIHISEQAIESGRSFRDNAVIKAEFYAARAGIPTIADDGGLEVDALGGAPGVWSHRWLGNDVADDRRLAEEVIRRMAGIEPGRRTARLRTAAALIYAENGSPHQMVAEAALEGIIAEQCYPVVRAGFPYRSVLFLPDRGAYLAELDDEEAARLSQRRALITQLAAALGRVAAG